MKTIDDERLDWVRSILESSPKLYHYGDILGVYRTFVSREREMTTYRKFCRKSYFCSSISITRNTLNRYIMLGIVILNTNKLVDIEETLIRMELFNNSIKERDKGVGLNVYRTEYSKVTVTVREVVKLLMKVCPKPICEEIRDSVLMYFNE